MTAGSLAPRDNAYAAAGWAQTHAAEQLVAVWLDGATAHVQFTAPLTPSELASLRASVPAPETLRVDTVQNSLAVLLSVRDAISARRAIFANAGSTSRASDCGIRSVR